MQFIFPGHFSMACCPTSWTAVVTVDRNCSSGVRLLRVEPEKPTRSLEPLTSNTAGERKGTFGPWFLPNPKCWWLWSCSQKWVERDTISPSQLVVTAVWKKTHFLLERKWPGLVTKALVVCCQIREQTELLIHSLSVCLQVDRHQWAERFLIVFKVGWLFWSAFVLLSMLSFFFCTIIVCVWMYLSRYINKVVIDTIL